MKGFTDGRPANLEPVGNIGFAKMVAGRERPSADAVAQHAIRVISKYLPGLPLRRVLSKNWMLDLTSAAPLPYGMYDGHFPDLPPSVQNGRLLSTEDNKQPGCDLP